MLNKTNTPYKLFCLLTLLLCACTEVPEHCGDRFPALNPSAQFCYQGRVEDKCGGKEYDPSTQGCYGNVIRSDANTLTINVIGNGTVSRSPNGVDYKWETEVTVTANPTDNNYVFTGWSGALESESPMITITMSGDKMLTANFVKLEANQFIVTLNTNGGTGSQESVITGTNGKLTSMPTPPTRNGYTFEGWFTETTGGTQVTTDLTFAANKTIYARWIAVSYTITYSLNGGKVQYANLTNYTVETATFTLHNPTREDFLFMGWTGSDITTPQKNVSVTLGSTGNRNYTANWMSSIEGTYTITYDLNGGTVEPENPNSYTVETATFTLRIPTREGYTFAGWTGINGENLPLTIVQGSMGDKSYTANWKPMIYTISYTSTGGWDSIPYNPRTYTIETESFTLNNPTWRGYTFTGWTGTNGATPQTTVSVAQGSMGNRSYVANWTLETYSITYYLNEGTVAIANPTSYTKNTGGGFTLNNPERPGYIFTGWTGTNGEIPQITVYVALSGSTGDKSYTANWKSIITHTITGDSGTFDYAGQTYKTKKIGNQWWMAENLNYDTADGNGSWCYLNSPDSCAKYGRLYTWYTAKTVCPGGWHLPSRREWGDLAIFAGGKGEYGSDSIGAIKLIATYGWWNNKNGTDDYGFSALPGGYRYSYNSYNNAGRIGSWWTATESDWSYAYYRHMGIGDVNDTVAEHNFDKNTAYSVRCLED